MGAVGEDDTAAEAQTSKSSFPIVTYAAIAASILVFALQTINDDPDAIERLGYRTAWDVWDGDRWALLTSVFVHGGFLHISFNLYWLWILGRAVERTLGAYCYLLFFVGAAWLSSAVQLAVTDNMGIGLSGVGYALFGFCWIARPVFPALRRVLDHQIVTAFLAWLVLCIVGTWAGFMNIGNAAHVAGVLTGVAVAGAVLPRWRRLAVPGLVLFLAAGTVAAYWAPWSPTWNGLQGYDAYHRDDFDDAIAYLTRAVELEPTYAWAHAELGWARIQLGQYEAAIADFDRSIELDRDSAWALAGRAQARRRSGDPEGALHDATRAIRVDRDHAYAHAERGWCRNALRQYAQAIEDFTNAIRLDPEFAWAYRGRAEARRATGDADGAAADRARADELR